MDSADNALNNDNSVATYVQSWYDQGGRIIARADHGTNHPDRIYVSGPEPPDSPPPVQHGADGEPIGPNPAGLPAGALLTCHLYDDAGRQVAVFQPDGTVTRYEYDGLGREILRIENAGAPETTVRRITAYRYSAIGQLVAIAVVLPPQSANVAEYGDIDWDAADGSIQVTKLIYGADVVNPAGGIESAHGGWVREIRFPRPSDGQPSGTDLLQFQYYSDGSVATRADAKGNVSRYSYDESGQCTEIAVDDSSWYTAGPPDAPSPFPLNRVRRVVNTYSSDGLLTSVTAYTLVEQVEQLLARNVFAYDARRNLVSEAQYHSGATQAAGTPSVGYLWDFSPVKEGNYNRLSAISYPLRLDGGGRIVSFDYGAHGQTDSALSRVRSVTDSGVGLVAQYAYAGTSRRVSTSYGNGMTQSVASTGSAYDGLDAFGREIDRHFRVGNATLYHGRQAYDASGNLRYLRTTQRQGGGGLRDNERSYLFEYDDLRRLGSASLGRLSPDGAAVETGPDAPIPYITEWRLDALDRWAGGDAANGSIVVTGDLDGDGEVEQHTWHHLCDSANRVNSIIENIPLVTLLRYDPNGNLIHDGNHVYQYDAWNRLVQVNRYGTVEFDADGRIVGGALGDLVARFEYDGLGRLIAKEMPLAPGASNVYREDYYYDGARRIQEVVDTQPGQAPPSPEEGELTICTIVSQYLLVAAGEPEGEGGDPGSGPVEIIVQQLECTPGPPPPPPRWTEREYIWSPHGGDDCLAQIGKDGAAMYVVSDAAGDVAALVGSGGTVREQYTHEPYGGVAVAESFGPHPVNRLGHHGLFFDHFLAAADGRVLVPGAAGVYYARNRHYHPGLGRWLQRDPNATGLAVLGALAGQGQAAATSLEAPDLTALYGDGPNLYAYVGSDPVNGRDPLGLYDEYDEAIDDLIGQRLYALGMLNEGSRFALVGMNLALDIAGTLLGADVAKSARDLGMGEGSFFDALIVAASVNPLGRLGAIGAKMSKAVAYAQRSTKVGRLAGTATHDGDPLVAVPRVGRGHGHDRALDRRRNRSRRRTGTPALFRRLDGVIPTGCLDAQPLQEARQPRAGLFLTARVDDRAGLFVHAHWPESFFKTRLAMVISPITWSRSSSCFFNSATSRWAGSPAEPLPDARPALPPSRNRSR